MDYKRMSSERLVLHFLASRGWSRVKTATDIEVWCRNYWAVKGVHRAGSTYRRAFQRLLAANVIRLASVESDHGARVFRLRRPVRRDDAVRLRPVAHGGAA